MSRRDLVPIAILLAAVAFGIAALELRAPYAFLWDDNATYYLPAYAHNFGAVAERGELALLNYHQYLGYTHLASGQTGVLYPPVYLAALAARLGWGDLRPTIELLVALHLLLAALGVYTLLGRWDVHRAVRFGLALLWVSFPFVVIVSRSWVFVSYAAALLPWGLLTLERLLERPGVGRLLAYAAVKALFLYQGYVQYAVLAMLCEGMWVAARWLTVPAARLGWWRQALHFSASLAAAAALSAPLLAPMWVAKEGSADRAEALAFEEFLSNALPLDRFFAAQLFDLDKRAIHQSTAAIFYIGLGHLAALGVLIRARRRESLTALIVAAVAFLLATSAYGMMYHVPIFESFRWPFKSFLIALFYLTIAFAGAYDTLWRGGRFRRWAGGGLLAAGIVANLVIVHRGELAAPLGPYHLDRSVAEFRAEPAGLFPVGEGRVVSMWLNFSEPRLHRFLTFNFATLAGAYHLGGYEPLVDAETLELAVGLDYSNIFRYELTPEALDYLSAWSVRFLVVPERPQFPAIFARFPQLRLLSRADGLEVWENAAALPFAFFVDEDGIEPVTLAWGVNGVQVATAGRGGDLRLTIAPLDGYVAAADGAELDLVARDELGRLALEVPDGTERLEVRYVDAPLRIGTGIFWAFVLSTAAIAVLRRD